MTKRLLSIGHGYSAQALARSLLAMGWDVVGTTRSKDKLRRAPDASDMVLFPGGDIAHELSRATHLLVSAGPDEHGDPFLNEFADELSASTHLQWIGYLSTTGVYGDRGGDWVTEDSEIAPSTLRGHRRKDAEDAWNAVARCKGLPLHIFRLAGIYGPGRGPFAKVRSGTARRIIKEGQVFSRIHVEDIAQVLLASINKPDAGAIFNVCDDEPAPPQDVLEYAAELLGLPIPPAVDFETADMSPMARSFYAESKRVCNKRIKEDLNVQLLYPDYRSGLRALLARDQVA